MHRSIANAFGNRLVFRFGSRAAIRHTFRLTLFCVAFCCCHAATGYNISMANPEQHLVQVQIILPEGSAERELQLPVWNALYQIRDFSQYVNWVRAKDRAVRSRFVR